MDSHCYISDFGYFPMIFLFNESKGGCSVFFWKKKGFLYSPLSSKYYWQDHLKILLIGSISLFFYCIATTTNININLLFKFLMHQALVILSPRWPKKWWSKKRPGSLSPWKLVGSIPLRWWGGVELCGPGGHQYFLRLFQHTFGTHP